MQLNGKNIMITGTAGGMVLLVATFVADTIARFFTPYNLFELGGIRPVDDPLMMLYFLYPFIFSIIAALVWSWIHPAITGTVFQQAVKYAGILFLLVIIPNSWVIFTTMTYPIGFHISNVLCGILGYPVIGYLNAMYNRE